MANTAAVTVTYNSSAVLDAFLVSLLQRSGFRGEVVVVDNASADVEATAEICRRHGAVLIRLPENQGYGAAVNRGVARVRADRDVLVANPDLVFEVGAVREMLVELRRNPRAGSVGPRILNDDGTDYPSARNIPSLRTGAGHAVFATVWPNNPWTRSYRDERRVPDARRNVGWLSGACLLIRRDAFEHVGGFDEGYFMYFEDVDLGWRLGRSGWHNVYEPSAVVRHLGGHSTSGSATMMAEHHRSAYRFVSARYPALWMAPIRWAARIGLAARASLVIRRARRTNRG